MMRPPIRGVRCEILRQKAEEARQKVILFFAAARLSHPLTGASKRCRKLNTVADWPLFDFACGSINRFYRFGVRSALALYGALGIPEGN